MEIWSSTFRSSLGVAESLSSFLEHQHGRRWRRRSKQKNETNFDEPFEKRESQLKLKGIHQERKKTQLRRKVR